MDTTLPSVSPTALANESPGGPATGGVGGIGGAGTLGGAPFAGSGAVGGSSPGGVPAVALVESGYATNLSSSAASFADSLARAAAPEGPSAVGQAMFEPLGQIDEQARSLADYAEQAIASGNELTPSEIVTLTAKSHEFMFRAQLTTNMANRTADGLQQLFRQQG